MARGVLLITIVVYRLLLFVLCLEADHGADPYSQSSYLEYFPPVLFERLI